MRRREEHLDAGRGGFSLVELLASLAIIAVLMAAIQSAVMLAARALPDGRSVTSAAVGESRPLDMIAADVCCATRIYSASATSLEFAVPDRSGDGQEETVRYAWSGTPGDPLTRQYKGGPAVAIANDVREFLLTYDRRSKPLPQTYSEGAEILLSSNDGATALSDARVNSSNWRGQFFRPTLPPSAASWRVTRVKFKAKTHGAAQGETKVQLRPAMGNIPSSIVLEQRSLLESNLKDWYVWQEFSFTGVSDLLPGTGLCLVLQWVSDADSCDVQVQGTGNDSPDTNFVTSTDSGVSWSVQSGQDMIYYVYGKATAPDAAVFQNAVTNVRCALRVGQDARSRVCTSIRVLNEPQAVGP